MPRSLTGTLCLFLCHCYSPSASAQLISQFTWDTSSDPLVATVGPNAASINVNATVGPRADGNTNGLFPGAGTNKADLDLVLADNAIFDIPDLDISYDYNRAENSGTILRRGNFIFGVADGISVTYQIDDGAGGATTVASTKTLVDRDDIFTNFRFVYDDGTGEAELFLDGVSIWTNPTKTPGQPLYWVGAGDIVVGTQIDGSGEGKAALDNFNYGRFPSATVPIELTVFRAIPEEHSVRISWETATERNNEKFSVDRTSDLTDWRTVATLAGAGDSDERMLYSVMDEQPVAGTAYYRLKQTDFDGTFTYSEIVRVDRSGDSGTSLSAFPNPTRGEVRLRGSALHARDIEVYDMQGREVGSTVSTGIDGSLHPSVDLKGLQAGTYFIRVDGQTLRVVKQ